MLNNFILEKINPIYKTIQKLNIPEKELKKKIEEKDIIQEVNDDVIKWARKKTKEIKKLKKLEKYRKEFLGNVSHELKTPIFNIQGYILTLLDGGMDDPTINKQYLLRSEKSINRMISIVEDLETISSLETGDLELRFEKFNIVRLIEEAFDMQDIHAQKKNISLKFDSSHDKSIMIQADRDKMFDVINNLINNSIKYGKDGGKTTVSFHDMGDNVLVEVADDGIGIAKKDLNRIFERFYRVDKSRSREQGGTGLGLAIVKHIIEAHGQTINVSSNPGNGSSFAFTLQKAGV
jgi:two-component system phosphate regulon sensor histidine kinase PhoR